ncbi:hypothetical protein DFR51_3600 [Sphingosinicella microcystinivorans]|uniref:Xaa-Pro dipeptidyl-peptidase C-terminal domain-containing protein n=2 Tax=Sphingosinicella microcystinivorans TaxID=335406 RepID=A0ABX9SUU8_SPHMI|nr:hypothetical protein DFR51_3600 [Sphingosinicella microcystinivorans]
MMARGMAALVGLCLLGACAAQAPLERPAGWSDQSYYLPMRDGVRVAVSLHFPGGKPPSAKATTILIQTRYGRAVEARRGGSPTDIEMFLARGYVVAVVDTRGSTASFGPRDVEMGPDERADMDEIIAHLAARKWSDGRVIGYGVSYMADTAEFALSRPAPALLASVPRQMDFDAYLQGFLPGGVQNNFLLYTWGNYTLKVDLGRSPRNDALDCRLRVEDCPGLFPDIQPVDEDTDFTLLRQALSGRRHWTPEDYVNAPFRDDKGGNGHSMLDFSPASELAGLIRENKPVMIWGSWMDATTAQAALTRFHSTPDAPVEIVITANNHGHDRSADPFFPDRVAPVPTRDAQFATVFDFMDRVRAGKPVTRNIHYYVLGADTFRDTRVWPPVGVADTRFYFAPEGTLLVQPPAQSAYADYTVDFTAGTGKNTRWSTQFGAPPIYPDRREADAKLLVFDSAAFDTDMELAGTPVIELFAAAQSNDPVFYVYLEDVAPDGRVTYITEGQLRAIHRAPADPETLPYDQGPAPHSFRRADALPVTPGKTMRMAFALNPTAALIRKGHRLRVAVAGADADLFRRYPEEGPERFRVSLGADAASAITVPLRPWR